MTNDELQKLAAALTDCGKALLKISEAMAVKEGNPPASEAKARKGFTEEVRSLIQKYGADKLSGIDTAQYKAFLKELEVIGHAG